MCRARRKGYLVGRRRNARSYTIIYAYPYIVVKVFKLYCQEARNFIGIYISWNFSRFILSGPAFCILFSSVLFKVDDVDVDADGFGWDSWRFLQAKAKFFLSFFVNCLFFVVGPSVLCETCHNLHNDMLCRGKNCGTNVCWSGIAIVMEWCWCSGVASPLQTFSCVCVSVLQELKFLLCWLIFFVRSSSFWWNSIRFIFAGFPLEFFCIFCSYFFHKLPQIRRRVNFTYFIPTTLDKGM